MSDRSPSPPDVCLILEGTYPYVSGGVSTWVHQIITSLPDLRFFIFHIGSEKLPGARYQYTLPANVTGVRECYLHGPARARRRRPAPASGVEPVLAAARRLLETAPDSPGLSAALTELAEHTAALARQVSFDDFQRFPGTWDLACALYRQHAAHTPFPDFFWSLRSLLEPAWRLIAALDEVPAARLYHSLCTGYAGLASGLAAARHGAPFLLSEHGIYVRERIAGLQNAAWIPEPPVRHRALLRQPGLLRRLWTEFFVLLGRFSYSTAFRITTLFSRNAAFQRELGAPPDKLEIIPNGVHPPDFETAAIRRRARLEGARDLPADQTRPTVGFLGRVVSIKDVKTLLRAARLTADHLPEVRFLIAGPLDEEPEYAASCQELCRALGLESQVRFMGPARREDLLPQTDVMLLTSLSEGLPFVILEAFAAGIPCVSTDVGACRELIEGRSGADAALGPAGLVTPVGQPESIASALLFLLTNRPLAACYGEAGRVRAATFYARDAVTTRYRALYTAPTLIPSSPPLLSSSAEN